MYAQVAEGEPRRKSEMEREGEMADCNGNNNCQYCMDFSDDGNDHPKDRPKHICITYHISVTRIWFTVLEWLVVHPGPPCSTALHLASILTSTEWMRWSSWNLPGKWYGNWYWWSPAIPSRNHATDEQFDGCSNLGTLPTMQHTIKDGVTVAISMLPTPWLACNIHSGPNNQCQ